MKLLLVRHGESEQNARINDGIDSKLTKKGEKQAEALGKRLKKEGIKIDEIYTSNLKRSKKTAEIISKIIKVPITDSFDGLNEYSANDLRSAVRRLMNGGFRKLKKIVKDLTREREDEKTVMIVAHGTTNRIIMGFLLQIPLKKYLIRFRHSNTSITVLEWQNHFKNWRMESMNDISHLKGRLR